MQNGSNFKKHNLSLIWKGKVIVKSLAGSNILLIYF